MASSAGHSASRVADWISTTGEENDGICVLQLEQCAVGDLGNVCRGVCIDRAADFPLPYEPARIQKKSR